MQALPLRSGDRTIGVLSLLDTEAGPMDDDQVDLAQALAATTTTAAAIRAPDSAIAFRLTVAIALLDVVLLITVTA